jgi:hypothetical protein
MTGELRRNSELLETGVVIHNERLGDKLVEPDRAGALQLNRPFHITPS